MKVARVVTVAAALFALSIASAIAQVSFGTATISGYSDDPGVTNPVAGYTYTVSGNTVTIGLPNFTASAFTSTTVNVSIPFTVTSGFTNSDNFLVSGMFTNAGFATGTETLQNSSGSVTNSGAILLPPSPDTGTVTLPSNIQSGFLVTQVTLGDDTQDGSSAVDTIQQTLSVAPEPSEWAAFSIGAMLLFAIRAKRAAVRVENFTEENR